MTTRRIVVVEVPGSLASPPSFRLQQAGASFLVLEAADRPGGRMTTDTVDGYVIGRPVHIHGR